MYVYVYRLAAWQSNAPRAVRHSHRRFRHTTDSCFELVGSHQRSPAQFTLGSTWVYIPKVFLYMYMYMYACTVHVHDIVCTTGENEDSGPDYVDIDSPDDEEGGQGEGQVSLYM